MELNNLGIEIEPVCVEDFSNKKMTFFHDPAGLPMEIHERCCEQGKILCFIIL